MRFNQISVPSKRTLELGIKEIDLKRLGAVVALVGKNGSGKSRILTLIDNHVGEHLVLSQFLDQTFSIIPKRFEKIRNVSSNIKELIYKTEELAELQRELQETRDTEIQSKITRLNSTIQVLRNAPNTSQKLGQVSQMFSKLQPSIKQYIRKINPTDVKLVQEAIAKDGQQVSFEKMLDAVAENLQYDEILSINRSSLNYLTKLPHQLVAEQVESLLNDTPFEKTQSFRRYSSLKGFVKSFLGKSLTWERVGVENLAASDGINVKYKGKWKIDNREFSYNEFSEGEKRLFAYALLFFLLDQNPTLSIKESILLIDEPELHLHPDFEIALIEGLKNIVADSGQLIIATHSINILATLSYDEIFLVKGGAIKHPSRNTPGESLTELLSIQDRLHGLSDFVSSIETWNYVNFVAQCFSNPEVIEAAKPNDPQIEAFKNAIKFNCTKATNILLDFGAGKGRLYEHILSDYEFIQRISYTALEPERSFHEKLKNLGAQEIYESYESLPADKYDFVVLCNVLHEIDISLWKDTLNRIIDSLNAEGYLIIIEAKVLTKGEKVGKVGFLLLDLEEISTLFSLSETPPAISIEASSDSITSAVLRKSLLNHISTDDVLRTLAALEVNTFSKLEALRSEETSVGLRPGIGRKTAFYSMQNINARLAKKSMEL